MVVVDQDIPSELRELYELILQIATIWQEKTTVRRRYPWRLPQMQGNGLITPDPDIGPDVTLAQFNVRKMFARAVYFWDLQPISGGVEPPAIGPRNRSWWYTAAEGSGLWYYNYFIQQTIILLLAGVTPDWCKILLTNWGVVDEFNPDTPYPLHFSTMAWKHPVAANKQTFIKTFNLKKSIWMMLAWWDNYANPPNPNLIYVHEVPTAWDMNTLTWNNKPALGTKLYEFSITAPIDVWYSLPIPAVYSIALVQQTQNALDSFYGETVLLSKIPFYSPFPK